MNASDGQGPSDPIAPAGHSPRLAVSLEYDGTEAPRVSASAAGLRAEELIRIAEAHDVPIRPDPELAAVLSTLEIDQAVPEALYVAVAEVIAFAWAVRQDQQS